MYSERLWRVCSQMISDFVNCRKSNINPPAINFTHRVFMTFARVRAEKYFTALAAAMKEYTNGAPAAIKTERQHRRRYRVRR